LPRPRLSLDYRPRQIGVALRWDAAMPEGWRALVRFRPKPDSPLDQYMSLPMDAGAVAWLPRAMAVGGQLCYQPGVGTEGIAIFEAWSCVPLEADRNR
jgi:hypothetical protein